MSNTKLRIRRTLLVVLPILGIAIGIALIVTGTQIEEIAADAKFYPAGPFGKGNLMGLGEHVFGSDYFTDMYEATAFTGNVLKTIFDILALAVPTAFELGGALIILLSLSKLVSSPLLTDTDAAKQNDTTTDNEKGESEEIAPISGEHAESNQNNSENHFVVEQVS